MNFIHIADVHLGATPDRGTPWSVERTQEIIDSFYRILDKAEEDGIDLLLIAGDLFHRAPLKRELKELNYRFSRMTRTKAVIIAGNHDYVDAHSYYNDFEWCDNVVFFKQDYLNYAYISELNTIVYGLSYHSCEWTQRMYDGLCPMTVFKDGTPVPSDCHHILLAHGGDEKHIPMNMQLLAAAGFDYIAMGHIHKPWLDSGSRMAYAGALEPIDRNDEGAHGYVCGSITLAGTHIEFVPFATRCYTTLEVSVTPEMTNGSLCDEITGRMNAFGHDNIFKVILKGFRSVDMDFDRAAVSALGNVISVEDTTVPDFDFEQLYQENQNNIIGQFIKKVTEMDMDDEVKARVLSVGMRALYQLR